MRDARRSDSHLVLVNRYRRTLRITLSLNLYSAFIQGGIRVQIGKSYARLCSGPGRRGRRGRARRP
jgi:hypothetical protein